MLLKANFNKKSIKFLDKLTAKHFFQIDQKIEKLKKMLFQKIALSLKDPRIILE
jgi:hypothetical protein